MFRNTGLCFIDSPIQIFGSNSDSSSILNVSQIPGSTWLVKFPEALEDDGGKLTWDPFCSRLSQSHRFA